MIKIKESEAHRMQRLEDHVRACKAAHNLKRTPQTGAALAAALSALVAAQSASML